MPTLREQWLHYRLAAVMAHLETVDFSRPRPIPEDDLWADGETDTRPWVDEPDADYAHDPWKGQP